MVLFPNAKINIGLDILRKRTDGYHEIETIMYPINWCDVLEITPSTDGQLTLSITGRNVECPFEKNLIIKAYRALNSIITVPAVNICLHKVIPDGAGLGGGSSDTAFTLKGLNELFDLGLSLDKLAQIAASIGADCPFFIYNRPMLCKGIGEKMSSIDIDLSNKYIAIIKPNITVPTAQAYAGVTPSIPTVSLEQSIKRPISEWQNLVKNDFEPSIFHTHNEIAKIKEILKTQLNAEYCAMSGSGSSVYGIFNYDILADNIAELFKGCDTYVSKISN
jgi:4-diphosphocytidyl-2-C-methyl-D-erythritol kinase